MHGQQLLELPAREAAALRALTLLGQAERARRRCRRGVDEEALHDFRVAVRRLRSHWRAYHEALPLPRKLDKALRRVARRTNTARDCEVALAWTRAQGTATNAEQRIGVDWLIMRLTEQARTAHDTARAELLNRWPPLAARLRHRLHRVLRRAGRRHGHRATPADAQSDTGTSYGRISAILVRRHAETLRASLSHIHTLSDHDAAHHARIRAKRLRYLVEPWVEVDDHAHALVARLRRLQDTLGDMRDGELMCARLGGEIEAVALAQARRLFALATASTDEAERQEARHSDPQPGLLALASQLHAQQIERFARLEGEHLGAAIATVVGEADRVADIIAAWTDPTVPKPTSTAPSQITRNTTR